MKLSTKISTKYRYGGGPFHKAKTQDIALIWSPPINPIFLSPSVLHNLPNCLFLPRRVGWCFSVHYFNMITMPQRHLW